MKTLLFVLFTTVLSSQSMASSYDIATRIKENIRYNSSYFWSSSYHKRLTTLDFQYTSIAGDGCGVELEGEATSLKTGNRVKFTLSFDFNKNVDYEAIYSRGMNNIYFSDAPFARVKVGSRTISFISFDDSNDAKKLVEDMVTISEECAFFN
ncbi:hypothetical protein A9Q84_13605 [Halobacteriovorax marinus]|uniref:Uncharacterized protein n=1 Tax=Halobacteriovorax marinus TaxID=97084 RepID=A0A1Y5F9A5_9BACT|nr:hypothetical protein A9Q84_13605 [Halobacteriovorax marinus]